MNQISYLLLTFFFNLQQDSNSRYSALNVQHQMLKVSNLKLFFMNKRKDWVVFELMIFKMIKESL
jgi:hypothetical protein